MDLADIECYTCGKKGHMARTCPDGYQVRREERKWGTPQRGRGPSRGRGRDHVKKADGETEAEPTSFCFRMSDCPTQRGNKKGLMVDCGATTHMINDATKFKTVDKSFRPEDHMIELADGSKVSGMAKMRGDAEVYLLDSEGQQVKTRLKQALYIPSFPQNIFSVKAATANGAEVRFKDGNDWLVHKDGTMFKMDVYGNINKTLLHDVSYNISNVLSAYLSHCTPHNTTFAWLKSRIDDLVSDYKDRLAVQSPASQTRSKRDLFADVTGLFGTGNSLANTYQITRQSQYSTWLANQIATGFQHITSGSDNIIKAVSSEAKALLTLSHMMFNQTHNLESELACRSYAQDLYVAARQEILDLRLRKTPRHALTDLVSLLDLNRWFNSTNMKNIHYAELLSTIMMYDNNECEGFIVFYVTFPFIHPNQVFPNSTTIRSLGVIVKDQIIKWDPITGYMTVKRNDDLFTTRSCCHETSSYVICTCNTLQPVSFNDTKLINVNSLHGYSDAIQVSHTQWCVVSEMTSFSYGGLTCPANHTFCLEVREDTGMTQQAYTWWDWVFRGCVIASLLILAVTLFQCCYYKHLINSLRTAMVTTLIPVPLNLSVFHGNKRGKL
ncbi:uncharacterized protein [Osmerus mordax]|uniref:uncharacterized protein n=1 Tax=Osmerus mordax TaxID=8014 RepID=UPI003510C334